MLIYQWLLGEVFPKDWGLGTVERDWKRVKTAKLSNAKWQDRNDWCHAALVNKGIDSSSLATRPTPNLSRPQHHPHHQLSHHLNHHHHHQRSSLSSPHSSLSSCMQTNHTQAFDAFKTHTHRWIYTTFTYRRLDKYRREEFSKSDAAGDVAGVPF